jgi:hypothetical protein
MFPDVRLLIGALFASVVTLCCGFGVFAAFRVNHEPLSRLPAATAPLQLVINEAAVPGPTWRAPIGGLLPMHVSDVGGAAAVRPTIASTHPPAIETSKATTATAVKTAAVVDAPGQHASPPAMQTASANPAIPATAAAKPVTIVAPSSTAAAPLATAITAPTLAASSASVPRPPDRKDAAAQTATAPLMTADVVKAHVPPPQTSPTESEIAPPAVAANEPATAAPSHLEQAPAAAVAAIDSATPQVLPLARPAEVNSETKPADNVQPAKLRKAIARPVERRRVAARRRLVRKPSAPVVAQFGSGTSTFHDPVFQSAPDFQTRQGARTRAAKTTANSAAKTTANSATTSNSYSWPSAQ